MRIISPKRLLESVAPTVRNGSIFNASSLDLQFARTKTLDPRITFTRASSGTYVGSDGLIKTATTNLQTWSEDFRNTADAGATRPWVYSTSAVTADNTAAPNGTSTADLIAGATGTTNKFLTNNISTTTIGFYTFSIYLKQGTEQFVVIRLTDGSANGIRGRFDLAAGTVVITNEGTATGQAASATSVGNGWYRCVVTCSVSSLPSSVMQPQLWLNNFASTSLTTNYYAWGAQLEQSSTVGEYIPTTSTINSAPRFDHNPTTGESLGLLVEESRTNLVLRSEEFDNASWIKLNTAVTSNQTTAPDGSANADLIAGNAGTATKYIYQSYSASTSGSFTFSVFAKAGTESFIVVRVTDQGGVNEVRQRFDLSSGVLSGSVAVNGTATAASSSINSVGNGWYRCVVTATFAAFTQLQGNVWLNSYASVSLTTNFYLWGAQLEAGSFPTSYIPTTTATVTRSADVANSTGANFSSWYNQTEGTVFADVFREFAVPSTAFPVIFDARVQPTDIVQTGYLTEALAGQYVVNNTVTQSELYPTGFVNVRRRRIASAYGTNNFAICGNGNTPSVDSLGTPPSNIASVFIGSTQGNSQFLNGTIRRLTYWPSRLPNATLQQITR